MEFNDLPLTLTPGQAEKITGLPSVKLRELEQIGILAIIAGNKVKRRYTRESVRKLLRLGPEGTKVKVT